MKQVTVTEFETPEEFISAIGSVGEVPYTVYLVVEEGGVYLAGEGAEEFVLGKAITANSLLRALLTSIGLSRLSKVYFT